MTTNDKKWTWRSRLNFAARFIAVVLISAFLVLSNEQRAAIAQALRDPMSVLASRSPGERDAAKLRQTKQRKEMVLPTTADMLRNAQVVAPDKLSPDPDVFAKHSEGPLPSDDALPTDGAAPPAGTPVDLASHGGGGGGRFFPGPVGEIGGGGPGGGGGCKKGENCEEPPPPVIPIPEPMTWLLIIAGFFALGGFMRRRFAQDSAALRQNVAD